MKYIAMIRGVGPGDPRMSNANLRRVFELMGFTEVQSLISSGNIVFSSSGKPSEAQIEENIHQQLGFFRPVIVRSQKDINRIIELQPFGSDQHSQKTYTLVTFLKHAVKELPLPIPFKNEDLFFEVRGYDKKTEAIFTITDHTSVPTPKVMGWLEKQFGKENVTSRTWKTVERINKVFS